MNSRLRRRVVLLRLVLDDTLDVRVLRKRSRKLAHRRREVDKLERALLGRDGERSGGRTRSFDSQSCVADDLGGVFVVQANGRSGDIVDELSLRVEQVEQAGVGEVVERDGDAVDEKLLGNRRSCGKALACSGGKDVGGDSRKSSRNLGERGELVLRGADVRNGASRKVCQQYCQQIRRERRHTLNVPDSTCGAL